MAWTPSVRKAARSRQWVEQRRSSRQRPTADGCLPLPSLRPAARLDLMGGEGREDESVGYRDNKRFSNSGMACS